ncbi:MAG: DUF5317 domain-containing protein [Microthrixaceae bacterium]|nr:DUF5317 family protein [Microthrixaceae bacterium]MCO5317545.1 DUF5317 domain-containing protein [Microthrixaceae bacterium]
MALIPTLVAIGLGTWLGLRWGGSFANLRRWRPVLPAIGLGGISLMVINDMVGPGGTPGVLVLLVALALVTAFAVLNLATGGMVLVAAGFGLNLLVTLLNWGMPVSTSALVSSGLATDESEALALSLNGGREVADGALLGFLGDVIPLPWGQVLSLGDLVWLTGLALVTASVLRRYEVRSAHRGPRRSTRGTGGYSQSLSALGRGPAPRRGPGLHPSRLGERRGR